LFVDDDTCEAISKEDPIAPEGITKVEGEFPSNVAVQLISESTGEEVGRGLVHLPSSEIERVMGKPSTEAEQILGSDEVTVIESHNLAAEEPKKD